MVAKIDALERDGIDEVVDWQLTDSPAAHTEHPRPRLGQAHIMFTVAGTADGSPRLGAVDPMRLCAQRVENLLRLLDEIGVEQLPPLTIPPSAS